VHALMPRVRTRSYGRAMMRNQGVRFIASLVLVAGLSTACTDSAGSASPAPPTPTPSAAPTTSADSADSGVSAELPGVRGQTAPSSATSEPHDLLPGRVATGADPVAVAVDAATQTLYVGTGTGLSVINDATCDSSTSSGCKQPPATIAFGASPVALAVDQATHTVYAVNEDGGTVSVVNGATCNASVTTGCGQRPQQVDVGSAPDGVAIDQSTDTVYVANSQDNTMSVINGTTCNAKVTSGCGQTPPTIGVGNGPEGLAVNELTDTVYVANSNDGTVSVIDGGTCNATVTTGCEQTPPAIGLGDGVTPTAVAIDQASDTVYAVAAGPGLGSVSVINGATCNATATDGCQQVPIDATVGGAPVDVVYDATTRSVLVLNQGDDSVSVIDGATCNASVTSGCGQRAPQFATGSDPAALDVDSTSNTIYVSNQSDNDVSVLAIGSCTSGHPAACRQIPSSTSVGAGPVGAALDSGTNTIYVANQDDGNLSVINAATCNARVSSGCATRWTTAATGDNPLSVAVDQATDTVYVANASPQNNPDGSAESLDGSTLSVIDGVHCNASSTSSCSSASTINVGQGPAAIAIDESTNTIYVTNFDDGTVSVINGATCDAEVTTGCAANPPTILIGGSPEGIAFDSATGTLYVADTGEDKVSVINGKTCNARVATGCTQTPATIAVGKEPRGVAIDIATDTVYVANYADHTVSVINGATCDASATTGCGQQPPTMATGASPKRGVAVDQATGAVFVDAYYADAVDVFDGSTCDAAVTSGCDQQPVAVPAGGQPVSVVFNPATDTIYASDNADGLLSFFAPPR
jgi:DNA-binding beta-propeller fold protein YncE